MKKCNIDCYGICQKEIYINNDKCILHCEKNLPMKKQTLNDIYQKDRISGVLSDFYDELIEYIIKNLFKHTDLLGDKLNNENLKSYLKSNKYDNEEYNNILKNTIFIPSCIHFPTRDGRDYFDYLKLLNLFGQIKFSDCEFYLSSLDLKNVKCFFQNCKFYTNWTLYNYGVLDNEDNIIYQTCEFYKLVSNYTPENQKELAIYKYSQFDYTCKFHSNIEFDRCHFNDMLFNTNQYNFLEENIIEQIIFENCIFDSKFKLNNFQIQIFKIIDTIFKDKFEFKENILDELLIDNSNFKKIVDLFGCNFKKFKIYKSIFDDFSGFENCTFGTTDKLIDELAIFKYATFKDALNVRDSKFLSGLDIKYINLYGESNFLDSKIESIEQPTRDTFRRLKYESDKIGNIIEANKHYQQEMNEREKELKNELPKSFSEWIVFKIHDISSEHSQNWLLSFYWIIVISLLYSHIKIFLCQDNVEYYILPLILNIIIALSVILELIISKRLYLEYKIISALAMYLIYSFISNDFTLYCFSNNLNPFSIMTGHDTLTLFTLVYKIIISYLFYQLIISIRQNTRRK